jgi:hypothetical protein
MTTNNHELTIRQASQWLDTMLILPDGTQGIYERYRINLRRINPWVRPDCCIESGRALYVAGQYHGDQAQMERGLALASFVCTMQDTSGGFLDGSFPFYRFQPIMLDERDIGDSFGIPDLPNFRWHNDNGKITELILWFYRETGEMRFRETAERVLAYLLRAQGDDGAFTHTVRGGFRRLGSGRAATCKRDGHRQSLWRGGAQGAALARCPHAPQRAHDDRLGDGTV